MSCHCVASCSAVSHDVVSCVKSQSNPRIKYACICTHVQGRCIYTFNTYVQTV